jgi:hypothetical protein
MGNCPHCARRGLASFYGADLYSSNVNGADFESEFAGRWAIAWSSRNLEQLLSLYLDNGSYINPYLRLSANGRRELRQLFANMLHGSNFLIESARAYRENGRLIIRWTRTGTLTDRLKALSKNRLISFGGQSMTAIVGGRVWACEDDWSDLGRALEGVLLGGNQNRALQERPGEISSTKTDVYIGGLRIPRGPLG